MIEQIGQWKKLSSKIAYKVPYYKVREDSVIKPDGSKGTYSVIEIPDLVFVIPLDDSLNIYLIELHRYTNNNLSIEIPMGGSDGQGSLAAAKRELKEETGLIANSWEEIGCLHPSNGIISSKTHVFIARGLQEGTSTGQKEEGITRTIKVPIKEALEMVKEGKITDIDTVAALMMVCLKLEIIKT